MENEELNTELHERWGSVGEKYRDKNINVFSEEYKNMNAELPSRWKSTVPKETTKQASLGVANLNDEYAESKDAKHFDELNYDAVDLLRSDKQSIQSIKENEDIGDAAIRMSEKYLGRENINREDAIDLVLEHFNKFDVNEMVAAQDLGYVSGLVTDMNEAEQAGRSEDFDDKVQQLNDYRLLFTAKNSLPFFFQKGGRGITAVGDVLEGIIQAPSTWIGLLLPVAGKAGAMGSAQAAKFGVTKLLQQVGKRPILTAVGVEAGAGLAQDVAAQKVEIETALKDDYSLVRTGAVTAISGLAPAALIPLTTKGAVISYAERNTGDLVKLSKEAIQERMDAATKEAEKLLEGAKVTKSVKEDAENVAEQLKILDPEAVKRGDLEFRAVAEKEGVEGPLKITVSAESYKSVQAALVEIAQKAGKVEPKLNTKTGKLEKERISETVARAIRKIKTTDPKTGKTLKQELDGDEASKAVNDFFFPLMKKYNLTQGNISDMFLADMSEAGRQLAVGSAIKKQLKDALTDVSQYDYFGFAKARQQALKELDDTAKNKNVRDYYQNTVSAKTGEIIKELDAARLAFMTSQPATTARNIAGSAIRLPMDALVRSVDTTLQKITGVERLTPNSDAWAMFGGFLNSAETNAVVALMKADFAGQTDRVLRPLIDMADATKTQSKIKGLSTAARAVNILNTISDNWFKKVALTGTLKRELNNIATIINPKTKEEALEYFEKFLVKTTGPDGKLIVGGEKGLKDYYKLIGVDDTNPEAWKSIFRKEDFNLANIIQKGRFHDVFGKTKEGRDAVQKAVEEALYFTYQRSPDNPLAKSFINGVHSLPFLATSLAPFPRFMVNAMRFTYEHSPAMLMFDKKAKAQLMALAGSKSAKEVTEGYTELSKSLVGTSVLMASTAFRMSEFAGENWYEGKTADGRTYDLRPFFPLAPYLFFADLIARKMEGNPVTPESASKLIQTTLSTVTGMQAFKTGFGLYTFESSIADIEEGNFQGMGKLSTEWAANVAETFTIPLSFGQDAYSTFFAPDDVRILKTLDSPNLFSLFINKSTKRLPWNNYIHDFMDETFENYEKPLDLTSPFTTEKIRRPGAIQKQYSGLMFRERKNLVQKEFIRLRIPPNKLALRTRDPKYNNLLNFLSAEFAVGPLHELMTSERYLKHSGDTQTQRQMIEHIIVKEFHPQKRYIMENLERGGESSKIVSFFKFNQLPEYEKTVAKNTYHEMINPKTNEPYGIPENDKYDYEILYDLGNIAKKAYIE
tara:strand:+ start:103 stop:3873 length:3771 start_codon:yes stop_codon:yes gene_type:complete